MDMRYDPASRRILVPAVLAAALLTASCDLQRWVLPQQDRPAPAYKNPHTTCAACHASDKPRSGGALFAPGADPSSACINCHDYAENHHPVDFRPADASRIPFPLFDGTVRCLTCHEIHGGPDKTGTERLLRGGPYPDRREICFHCHSQEAYASIDPHRMLDAENRVRQVNGQPVCLLCHSKMPDPVNDYTTDVRFRADVGFLCWRCHPPMPDPFFSTHFLVTPSAQTLENMKQAEERDLIILPLVPRGRITCSTCHNPHQRGVLQHESAAKGADSRHKIRTRDLCSDCHPTYLRTETGGHQ